jgi:hypothetical protein
MNRFLKVPKRFEGLLQPKSKLVRPTRYNQGTFKYGEDHDHGTYGALLFDDRWKKRRVEILERDNFMCRVCGKKENLHVHHRQYHFIQSIKQFKPPWDYSSDLLLTLCESCHSRGHSKFKVPSIYL